MDLQYGTEYFRSILQENYGTKEDVFDEEEIEYVEPYKGPLGVFPAEIYDTNPKTLNKILKLINELKLTQKTEYETPHADIITSNARTREGVVHIIFTNTKALDTFKQAIYKNAMKVDQVS